MSCVAWSTFAPGRFLLQTLIAGSVLIRLWLVVYKSRLESKGSKHRCCVLCARLPSQLRSIYPKYGVVVCSYREAAQEPGYSKIPVSIDQALDLSLVY